MSPKIEQTHFRKKTKKWGEIMADKDWTQLFSPIILSRGRNYYAVGKVKHVTAEDNGLEVTVHDQADQQVSVILSNQKLLGIGCTCKEGEQGRYCAHMAAALCRLEKDYGRILIDDKDLAAADKEPGQDSTSDGFPEKGAGPGLNPQKKKLSFSTSRITELQERQQERSMPAT